MACDLVLIPGLLCDAGLWRHQVESLADIATVAVADVTGQESIEAMAAMVLTSAPPRFAVAGLSMGGYVAQEVIRQAPHRVDRLALLDTNAHADPPAQSTRRRDFIGLARRGRFTGVTPQLLPFLVHPSRLDDRELKEAILSMAARVGRDAFIRQQTAIIGRKDGRADLASIRCPTVVLCGRQDGLAPVAIHAEMAAAIPDAALIIIEDAGHLTPLEQPHAVSAVLRYWLQVGATKHH